MGPGNDLGLLAYPISELFLVISNHSFSITIAKNGSSSVIALGNFGMFFFWD